MNNICLYFDNIKLFLWMKDHITIDVGNVLVAIVALYSIWMSIRQTKQSIDSHNEAEMNRIFREERENITNQISSFIFDVKCVYGYLPNAEPNTNENLNSDQIKKDIKKSSKHRYRAIKKAEFIITKFKMGTKEEVDLCDRISDVLYYLPTKNIFDGGESSNSFNAIRQLYVALNALIKSYQPNVN